MRPHCGMRPLGIGLVLACSSMLSASAFSQDRTHGCEPPPEPRRIEFASDEGTPLVGTFYPVVGRRAPGVLLLHQRGASVGVDRRMWEPLVERLWRPGRRSYAVFSFDLPGHGESGGTEESSQAYLDAARTALALFRTFEGVDPNRIVIIGASSGADAAVALCRDGCVAAAAISPGDYLQESGTFLVRYRPSLIEMLAQQDRPVLCVAATGDRPSPEMCLDGHSVGLTRYRSHIYEGTDELHGNFLLLSEAQLSPPPQPLNLVTSWLRRHVPLR